MKRKLPMDMGHPLVSPRKRPRGGDDGQGRESKRKADKDPGTSSGQSGSSESNDMKPATSGADATYNVSIITLTHLRYLEFVGR